MKCGYLSWNIPVSSDSLKKLLEFGLLDEFDRRLHLFDPRVLFQFALNF